MDGVFSENQPPLRFRFLANTGFGPNPMTGHSQGLITVNLAEGDDDERERQRINLREPFRTLVGHLRPEIAHYYWGQLIPWAARLTRFCELFGNEEQNYDATLQTYYQQGPPFNWQARHISAYASAHPCEDWAETWAHYFHIVETVETAASFGITLSPRHPDAKAMTADPKIVAEPDATFDKVLEHWLPLTCALNSLNRAMGLPSLYPFVLSKPTIEKLQFVHEVILAERVKEDAPESAAASTPQTRPIDLSQTESEQLDTDWVTETLKHWQISDTIPAPAKFYETQIDFIACSQPGLCLADNVLCQNGSCKVGRRDFRATGRIFWPLRNRVTPPGLEICRRHLDNPSRKHVSAMAETVSALIRKFNSHGRRTFRRPARFESMTNWPWHCSR